jgi:hypothetical protein
VTVDIRRVRVAECVRSINGRAVAGDLNLEKYENFPPKQNASFFIFFHETGDVKTSNPNCDVIFGRQTCSLGNYFKKLSL